MKERLISIDVFRGMTIFFMIIVNTPGTWDHVYAPLRHAEWNGLTPTDLVFPFFVFIVGLSMSFSFNKFDPEHRGIWIRKILWRTAMIFVIGLLLNWFPFNKNLSDLRIFGVLQRIALAYGFSALLVVFVKKKWLYPLLALILISYYILLIYFGGEKPLSLEDNAVRILDLLLFTEAHVYHGYGIPFDPEGLLSTLPAVGTAIFGYLVGKQIQSKEDVISKSYDLIPIGAVAIVIGIVWHHYGFPVNKPLWSSSYVLVTGGMATLVFSMLVYLVDFLGKAHWFQIFRPFGLNALVSYVLSGLILKLCFLIKVGETNIYSWLYNQLFNSLGPEFGSFIQALAYTLLIWLFALWLYRKQIVIKI